MDDEKKILIEKFIDGEISKEDNILFEKLLTEDEEFKKEYLLRLDVNNAVSESDIISLKSELDSIYDELYESPKFTLKRIWYYAAASIIIFVLSSAVLGLFENGLPPTDAFEKYYNKYQSIESSRNNNSVKGVDSLRFLAFHHYDIGNYEQSYKYFERLTELDNDDFSVKFFHAMTLIELNNFENAEEVFIQLLSYQDHLFYEQANWYLALVYLKMEKDEEAKCLLHSIIDCNMVYKKNAKQILKDLRDPLFILPFHKKKKNTERN